jgi:soluble lytic murein transglycosylase-like protein
MFAFRNSLTLVACFALMIFQLSSEHGFAHAEAKSSNYINNTAPAKKAPYDKALITALYNASKTIAEDPIDLDALSWLSEMSDRTERYIKNPFYRVRLLKAIHKEALRANLDPQLVLAVIQIESAFNRYAISSAGAQGLMQVMPFWKEIEGEVSDDLFHPLVNLRYGCTILRHYLDRFKDLEDALAAYNGSYGRKTYSDKVLAALDRRWKMEQDVYSKRDPKLGFASN